MTQSSHAIAVSLLAVSSAYLAAAVAAGAVLGALPFVSRRRRRGDVPGEPAEARAEAEPESITAISPALSAVHDAESVEDAEAL